VLNVFVTGGADRRAACEAVFVPVRCAERGIRGLHD
jgi:hypothetical protein